MDNKSLQAYLTLYRAKSIHKAADQLFISQQGLSKMLQNMEKEYQCKFFVRTNTGLIQTKEGERYYRTALLMQRELDVLETDLQEIAEGKESISIACSFGTMHMLYPKIRRFYRKYPNIIIHWREYPDREADQILRSGECNLLFYVEGDGQNMFEKLPLFAETCGVLVYDGHPFREMDGIRLPDLKDEWILIEGRQFHIYSHFLRLCENYGFFPEIIAETSDITLSHRLCGMGEGLAILPKFIAEQYTQPQVRWLPLEDADLRFAGGLAKLKSRELNSAEQKFWKFLTQEKEAGAPLTT